MPLPLAARLPYMLHTNRELGLMLAGKKPLAMFADGRGQFPDHIVRYIRLFDRHVANGTIVRRDDFSHPPPMPESFVLHRILFALPAETWRIDAMLELKASPIWSREHERREGELLGYEDWMNDHFLSLLP